MTGEEYQEYLNRLSLAGQLIADVPIAELLNTISHCDTIGPIVDPTAWMRGADNLRDQEDLVRAASRLVSWGSEFIAAATK